MTNKEAIEQLKWVENRICQITCLPETFEAINLAIKALEFAESQSLCCENCANRNRKSKEVCTSPYGVCRFFEDKTQEGGAENERRYGK